MLILSNDQYLDGELRLIDEECDIWHMETDDGSIIETVEDAIERQIPFSLYTNLYGNGNRYYLQKYYDGSFLLRMCKISNRFSIDANHIISIGNLRSGEFSIAMGRGPPVAFSIEEQIRNKVLFEPICTNTIIPTPMYLYEPYVLK
jgi:hypothetical protein